MSTGASDHAGEKFSAYLEGDLSAADRSAVEAHLGACTECRVGLERFRATIGDLARLKHKAPASFLPDIQRQIYTRSRGRFFGKRWLLFGRLPFEWVSLVMIIAMLLYYIVTLQSEPVGVAPGGG